MSKLKWAVLAGMVALGVPVAAETIAADSISINFGGNDVANPGDGLVSAQVWKNYSEVSYDGNAPLPTEKLAQDASGATANWGSPGTYGWNDDANSVTPILRNYLDDSNSANPWVRISGIPFERFDVIVYQASDTEGFRFNSPSVNGRYYDLTGAPVSDAVVYGQTRLSDYSEGENAVYLRRAFATNEVYIVGGGKRRSARGCIAAVQVIEVPVVSARPTEDAAWSDLWTSTATPRCLRALEPAEGVRVTIASDVSLGADGLWLKSSVVFAMTGALTVSNGIELSESAVLTLDCAGVTTTAEKHYLLNAPLDNPEAFAYVCTNLPAGYEAFADANGVFLQKTTDAISINVVGGTTTYPGAAIPSEARAVGAYCVSGGGGTTSARTPCRKPQS